MIISGEVFRMNIQILSSFHVLVQYTYFVFLSSYIDLILSYCTIFNDLIVLSIKRHMLPNSVVMYDIC
jgi:hypothetical protein